MRETVQRYLCLLAGVDMSQMKGTDSIQQFGANKPDIMNTNRSFAYQPPIQQTQQTNVWLILELNYPLIIPLFAANNGSTYSNLFSKHNIQFGSASRHRRWKIQAKHIPSSIKCYQCFNLPAVFTILCPSTANFDPGKFSTVNNACFRTRTTQDFSSSGDRYKTTTFYPNDTNSPYTKVWSAYATPAYSHFTSVKYFGQHINFWYTNPTDCNCNKSSWFWYWIFNGYKIFYFENIVSTAFIGVSTTDNNSPNVPASFSSTSQNSAQISDDRNNAWESFLKRNDTYSDNNLPTVLNLSSLGSVSHQQQSASSSHEISDKWESFLRQKDRVRILQLL